MKKDENWMLSFSSNEELLRQLAIAETRASRKPGDDYDNLVKELDAVRGEYHARWFAPRVEVIRSFGDGYIARVVFRDCSAARTPIGARRRAEQVYRLAARVSIRFDYFSAAAVCVDAMDGRLWIEAVEGDESTAHAYARALQEVLDLAIAEGEVIG
jgi:hypothetical protein